MSRSVATIKAVRQFLDGKSISFLDDKYRHLSRFPDRLEVRYDATGSTNVGSLPTDVGSYTSLLTTVNPGLTLAGYPNAWTQISVAIPASAPSGRVAFRYFVTNGGPAGANSDYIGVDTMTISSVPEPTSLGLVGLAAVGMLRRRRSV